MSDYTAPRRSAALVLTIALAWLIAAAALAFVIGELSALRGAALVPAIATLVLRLAPPLAVAVVAVEVLRRTAQGDEAALAELEARTAAAAAAGQVVRDGLFDLDATLTAIGGRLGDLRAATATETPRLVEAGRTVEALTTALATATGSTAAAARDLAAALPAAHEQGAALATALAAGGSEAAALLASIDAARTGLEAIDAGGTGTAARMDHIVAASTTLGEQLGGHDAQTAALIATVERSFTVLDKRLGLATAMGTATLDTFHAKMAAVRDLADAVAPRLNAAGTSLAAVEDAASRLAPAAAAAEGLAASLGHAAAPADRLAATITAARADLAGIEDAVHGSALAAATQLIEVLGRVREVAATAAGTLRTALDTVVAEAETALAAAGTRTAASAFADPIRHEIAGLEGAADLAGEAAQATADRIAARLLGLTQAVATVERRLAAVSPDAARP